jgi:hypothetical protein
MTIADVKTRFIANRQITDPATRDADWQTLLTDIETEWGSEKIDEALQQAFSEIRIGR